MCHLPVLCGIPDWAEECNLPFLRDGLRYDYPKEADMGKQEIIEMVLQLKAVERNEVAEQIMQSLDKSDAEIDRIWAEEALHRAQACDEGRMKLHSFDEVFGDK